MDTQQLPDSVLADFAPFVDLRNKTTGKVQRFSKVGTGDCYKVLDALRGDWTHDTELSARDSAEDGDNVD